MPKIGAVTDGEVLDTDSGGDLVVKYAVGHGEKDAKGNDGEKLHEIVLILSPTEKDFSEKVRSPREARIRAAIL